MMCARCCAIISVAHHALRKTAHAGLHTGLSEDGIEKLDAARGFSEHTAERGNVSLRQWVCFSYPIPNLQAPNTIGE